MNPSPLLSVMKRFVKASEEQASSINDDNQKQSPKPAFVSGTHVKQFYEQVVGKDSFDVSNKNETRNRANKCDVKIRKRFNAPFNINTLMKAVETGNVTDVEKILDGNEDKINYKDQFGWTPLMSACCAGHQTMVQSLLKWHPQLDVMDKKGNTCRRLASSRGHSRIVDILDKYIADSMKTDLNPQPSSSDLEQLPHIPFYCKTCKLSIKNTSLKKHLSSMVHNFNAASKKKMPTMYGIPESNKGFQILLRSGWNKETGLGPSGEGHKFPPKTILKQDRTGFGAKQYKPRVTHSLEDARREAKPKESFKRNLKSQKRKEQRLERNLREMLS